MEYPKSEIERQTNYIIAVSHANRIAFEKSILSAGMYVKKHPLRKVVIISNIYKNEHIKEIKYNQTQRMKTGEIRIIKKPDDVSYSEMFNAAIIGLKTGLLIVDENILDESIIPILLNIESRKKAIDIIVHRKYIELFASEKQFINDEIKKANDMLKEKLIYKPKKRILLRVHNERQFPFSPDKFKEFLGLYGNNHAFKMFLSQYIAVRKTLALDGIIKQTCEQFKEKPDDFVDMTEYEKVADNFVYYDFLNAQILGVDTEFIEMAKSELKNAFE